MTTLKTSVKTPAQEQLLQRRSYEPQICFSPTAWAKLMFFCHHGLTEIGGFGITGPEDPLRIEEFVTVRQRVSSVSVAFDDDAVANYFDDQVDLDRKLTTRKFFNAPRGEYDISLRVE